MIHHVSVGASDVERARAFYDPLMELVGLRLTFEDDRSFGYGAGDTVFSVETPENGAPATAGNGVHVAFAAKDRATVDEFHRVALANGGEDAGAPGPRPNYDANYYAAFVRDPEGNKIEAVTFVAK